MMAIAWGSRVTNRLAQPEVLINKLFITVHFFVEGLADVVFVVFGNVGFDAADELKKGIVGEVRWGSGGDEVLRQELDDALFRGGLGLGGLAEEGLL